MMAKLSLQDLIPPIVQKLLNASLTVEKSDPEALFDGDDLKFKEIVKKAAVYAEYGCGASTVWVNRNCACTILSVDSSPHWIDSVKAGCDGLENTVLHHVDLGKLGEWGKPKGYVMAKNFEEYREWIWVQEHSPDVVLIDGRFRVACSLTSFTMGEEGTVIIFDDYTDRQHYHVVEELIKPETYAGRQAIFRVSASDRKKRAVIRKLTEKFEYVMD